jgi:osmotically-inducible protein OsmY
VVDVKTALMADSSVNAANVNVDVHADTKTVVLRGSVPSADQKAKAGQIAQSKAPGYTIDNQLTVAAAP